MRTQHGVRGWKKGRPRTKKRYEETLAEALAPSTTLARDDGGAEAAAREHVGPLGAFAPPAHGALPAPKPLPVPKPVPVPVDAPAPASPHARLATSLVIDENGAILTATGLDPTIFGVACAALVGRNVFTCVVADDIIMLAQVIKQAPSIPGVIFPVMVRFVGAPQPEVVWSEASIWADALTGARAVTIEVAPPRRRADVADETSVSVKTDLGVSPESHPAGHGDHYNHAENDANDANDANNDDEDDELFIGFTYRQLVRLGCAKLGWVGLGCWVGLGWVGLA